MQLGWVDFSNQDRKRALDALALIKGSGAVDELGLGIVRDAFANHFFPGTSTIQTRAKYFIILNNILDDFSYKNDLLRKGKVKTEELVKLFRKEEYYCAEALSKNCTNKKGQREVGIIGGDPNDLKNQNKWIIRTPSVIYWNGLKTYGIINNINSVRDYMNKTLYQCNKIGEYETTKKKRSKKNTDENDYDDENSYLTVTPYHINTVDKGDNWIENLTLALSRKEALFLKRQITKSVPSSLLSTILLTNFSISDSFKELSIKDDFQKKFPHKFELFSKTIQAVNIDKNEHHYLDLACQFNKLSTLLRIRYNMILSNMENEDYNNYWNLYSAYANDLKEHPQLINEIYALFKLTGKRNDSTRKFLNNFLNCFILRDEPQMLDRMTSLIKQQEIDLKRKDRAKLLNPQVYYNKNNPAWIGGEELDFRLENANRIIEDIYRGLK